MYIVQVHTVYRLQMKKIFILFLLLLSTSLYAQDEDWELINDLDTGKRKLDLVILEVITEFIQYDSKTPDAHFVLAIPAHPPLRLPWQNQYP